jgi:WD40 repeat protein
MGFTLLGLIVVTAWFAFEKLIHYSSSNARPKVFDLVHGKEKEEKSDLIDGIDHTVPQAFWRRRLWARQKVASPLLPAPNSPQVSVPASANHFNRASPSRLTARMKEVVRQLQVLQSIRIRGRVTLDQLSGASPLTIAVHDPLHKREQDLHPDIPKVDLNSLRATRQVVAHRACVKHVKFSPDGQMIATSSEESSTIIYSLNVSHPRSALIHFTHKSCHRILLLSRLSFHIFKGEVVGFYGECYMLKCARIRAELLF